MPVAVERGEKLKVLIRRAAIQKRVREVAHEITRDFKGQRVHLVGVLKGACIFLSDLVREINLDTSIDFIAVSSYGKGKESSGQVRLVKDLDSSVEGLITAAAIWTSATIGAACGLGNWAAVLIAALIVIFLLAVGGAIERRVGRSSAAD